MADNDSTMQVLLLPSNQNQDLVNISLGGQLAANIMIDKGFRTPAELGNARSLAGHMTFRSGPPRGPQRTFCRRQWPEVNIDKSKVDLVNKRNHAGMRSKLGSDSLLLST